MEKLEYKNRNDLKLHMELIDFYKDILSNNSIFRAAVIVGSFAKGHPDRISDIDLITFVEDERGKDAFAILK